VLATATGSQPAGGRLTSLEYVVCFVIRRSMRLVFVSTASLLILAIGKAIAAVRA
jgi:hypothetical protein